MSGEALLDVNVLVALFDPDHVHHDLAHDWFADNRAAGWATCPITENGFVRVLSNPAYGSRVTRLDDLVTRLKKFCASGDHRFWTDVVSLRDDHLFNASFVAGHRQITDIYLLSLARKMRGRLVTFDAGIPLKAVTGATSATLEVVAPIA